MVNSPVIHDNITIERFVSGLPHSGGGSTHVCFVLTPENPDHREIICSFFGLLNALIILASIEGDDARELEGLVRICFREKVNILLRKSGLAGVRPFPMISREFRLYFVPGKL